MKVKVGQLKTHLSSYLRQLSTDKEPIEVCVREKTVAYLTPVTGAKSEALSPEDLKLQEHLLVQGLRMENRGWCSGALLPPPGKAEDGKVLSNSVISIRNEKDW